MESEAQKMGGQIKYNFEYVDSFMDIDKRTGKPYLLIEWSESDLGFGSVTIDPHEQYQDELIIDSEAMGREFVKALLCAIVDRTNKDSFK